MSDKAIEVIADALEAVDGADYVAVANVILHELKDARIAVVELPGPTDDTEEGRGWSSGQDQFSIDRGVYVSTEIVDGLVYDQWGGVSPAEARIVAADWLAAVDAAEAVTS